MSSTDTSAYGAKDEALVTALGIYLPVLLIGILAYEYARHHYKKIYNPKHLFEEKRNIFIEKEPSIKFGFGWISNVLSITDDEIMEFCGLDALVYIRFQQLGLKICLCIGLFAIILMPIYAARHGKSNTGNTVTQLSIGNLDSKDTLLWITTIAVYFISFYTMFLLHREYLIYLKRRKQYLSLLSPGQYTILLDDLPKKLQSESALHEYLQPLFNEDIYSVTMVCNLRHIEKLILKKDKLQPKYEHAVAEYRKENKRPQHIEGQTCCCCGGHKVDSIDIYGKELKSLEKEIAQAINEFKAKYDIFEEEIIEAKSIDTNDSSQSQSLSDLSSNNDYHDLSDDLSKKLSNNLSNSNSNSNSKQEKGLVLPSAFISFRTLLSVSNAFELFKKGHELNLSIQQAPQPDDVNWKALGHNRSARKLGFLLGITASVALTIFWAIPVGIVTSLSNLSDLQKRYSSVKTLLDNNPWLSNLLQQLSPIIINSLISIVPIILKIFTSWELHSSILSLDVAVYRKFSIFLIIQIFIVVSIAASASAALSDIIKNPQSAASILGQYIPEQAVFFMIMILIQSAMYVIDLLRIVDIILGWIYDKFAPKLTERERTNSWLFFKSVTRPGTFQYSQTFSNQILFLVLIFCYGIISPLFSFFGILHFAFTSVLNRRQLIYVYDYSDSGGSYWHGTYWNIIIGLFLGQLTILGVVSIKGGEFQAILFVFLLICTLIFHSTILNSIAKDCKTLNKEQCELIDEDRQQEDFQILSLVYRQKALQLDKDLSITSDKEDAYYLLLSDEETPHSIAVC